MASLDPKETLDRKESQVRPDSKATLVPRVFQGHREPSDPPERRVLLVNQDCQECLELMVPLVTPERKGLPERKDTWVLPVLKGQSVTLDQEA